MKFETRTVLAAAYEGGVRRRSFASDAAKVKPARMLTHTVEVDDSEQAVRVLCNRVDLESICDQPPWEGDYSTPPTCERCKAKDPRQRSSS